jgi:hypothetical protein
MAPLGCYQRWTISGVNFSSFHAFRERHRDCSIATLVRLHSRGVGLSSTTPSTGCYLENFPASRFLQHLLREGGPRSGCPIERGFEPIRAARRKAFLYDDLRRTKSEVITWRSFEALTLWWRSFLVDKILKSETGFLSSEFRASSDSA